METELQQAERTAKAWLEWPAVNQVATLARVFLAQQARLAEVQEGAEEEMRQRDHYRAMWQAAESRLASARAECAAKVRDMRTIYTNKPYSDFAQGWHEACDAITRALEAQP